MPTRRSRPTRSRASSGLDGKDVYFLTGTDEHGLKMKQTATKEGLTPRELADRNTKRFREMAGLLGLSNDDFIRTTEERHYKSSQEIWRRMEKAGDIFLKNYGGWYSVRDEAFYAESETVVGPDNVRRGPQGTPVEWTEEETYFFKLSAYQDRLLAHYERHPDFILPPERRNEVVSFVKGGLEDLSISRTTLDWGIPVPEAKRDEAKNALAHVMYVWVDALTNYITGVGFPDETAKLWHYWPADVHVIGKDILRFHAVYWPAFLMSAGIALPKRVFSHGFVLSEGREDVEVDRQRRRSLRSRARLRARSGALFLPARGQLRPRRQLQPRGDRQPHQRRSRQRPRQSRPALAVDDRQELLRPSARARRLHRGRSGRSLPRPTRSTARRARRWTARPSPSISTPSGPSSPTPTAISPARSRGLRRRPTSSAWRPSSM